MVIAVTDANIFIDLILADLLNEFFLLPLEIHTTEEILFELDYDQVAMLKRHEEKGNLHIEINVIIEESLLFSNRFSPEDIGLLSYVYRHNALMISGERLMRHWCKQYNIDYHGILWIFDQLLKYERIDLEKAIISLKFLVIENERLPNYDCQLRIRKWQQLLS